MEYVMAMSVGRDYRHITVENFGSDEVRRSALRSRVVCCQE